MSYRRHTGAVKFCDRAKRFGFLVRDDSEPDLFCGSHAMRDAGIDDPEVGMRISFEITEDRSGRPKADEVRLEGGTGEAAARHVFKHDPLRERQLLSMIRPPRARRWLGCG